jgi:hypothetical protein
MTRDEAERRRWDFFNSLLVVEKTLIGGVVVFARQET